MYCKNCGAQITNDAKFCPKCGTAVGQTISNIPNPEIPVKQKKPITKRFWFWAIIVVILILAATIYNTGVKQMRLQQSQERVEYGQQVFNELMNEDNSGETEGSAKDNK